MNRARITQLFFTLILVGLAFLLGRFTQPKPQLSLSAHITGDMDVAWDNFLEMQEKTRQFILSQPQFHDSPQSAAEGYRSLLYNMAGAIDLSLHDPDFPRFSRMPDLGSKSGMDNPDNDYKMALIDGEKDYIIRGQLNSGRQLYLQSVYGQPGVGDAGPGSFVGSIAGSDIEFGPNRTFLIYVASKAPDGAENWLRIDEGVEIILLRYTDSEWSNNVQSDWITIEKVCPDCDLHPDNYSPESAIKLLNNVSASLHDRTVSWVSIANRIWTLLPTNKIGEPRPTPNGLTGQYSAFGKFDLEDDEALILSVPVSDIAYQAIQLGNRWFHSLEYQHRQSSLTVTQSKPDETEIIHYVISKKDPGVWNWLDTGGLRRGLIMIRWQGSKTAPQNKMGSQLIDVSEIKSVLPEESFVSPDERKAQMERRADVISKRYQ